MNTHVAALLVGLAAGAAPAWWLTADHYQGVIAEEHEVMQRNVIEQQQASLVAFEAYIQRGKTAGVEHDKNASIVRNLNRELDRVRVNFPTCAVSEATEAGTDTNGTTRILSDSVAALFARLQSRVGELGERCDKLNIDAIRLNAEMVE